MFICTHREKTLLAPRSKLCHCSRDESFHFMEDSDREIKTRRRVFAKTFLRWKRIWRCCNYENHVKWHEFLFSTNRLRSWWVVATNAINRLSWRLDNRLQSSLIDAPTANCAKLESLLSQHRDPTHLSRPIVKLCFHLECALSASTSPTLVASTLNLFQIYQKNEKKKWLMMHYDVAWTGRERREMKLMNWWWAIKNWWCINEAERATWNTLLMARRERWFMWRNRDFEKWCNLFWCRCRCPSVGSSDFELQFYNSNVSLSTPIDNWKIASNITNRSLMTSSPFALLNEL